MKSLSHGLRASLFLAAGLTVVGCEQSPLTAPKAILASKSVSTIAASNGPFAYVADYSSNTVSVIATASNTVVATIGVGSRPFGVAITPQRHPTTAADCKKDGGSSLTRGDGSSFANQGDCIQYVNTGK